MGKEVECCLFGCSLKSSSSPHTALTNRPTEPHAVSFSRLLHKHHHHHRRPLVKPFGGAKINDMGIQIVGGIFLGVPSNCRIYYLDPTPPWEKRGKESRESDRRVELGHDVCSPFFSLFLLLVLFLSISSLFLPSFFFLLLLIQAAAASKKRGGRSLGSKASGGLNPPAFRTCSKHPLLLFPHTRSTTVQAPAAHPSPHLLPPSLSPPLPSRREDDILGRRTGGKSCKSMLPLLPTAFFYYAGIEKGGENGY